MSRRDGRMVEVRAFTHPMRLGSARALQVCLRRGYCKRRMTSNSVDPNYSSHVRRSTTQPSLPPCLYCVVVTKSDPAVSAAVLIIALASIARRIGVDGTVASRIPGGVKCQLEALDSGRQSSQ